MHNSRVIELIKCLNTKEVSHFRKMLVSPFFTRKEAVKDLFEYLIKFYPAFDDEKRLNKTVVFEKVFGAIDQINAKKRSEKDLREITKRLKNPAYD